MRKALFSSRIFTGICGCAILLILCSGQSTVAAAPSNTPKGLFVSPATQFLSINAGTQKNGTLTVANYTASPLIVSLSIKQFSVNGFSYTYNFNPPSNDWLTLGVNQASLAPGQSQTIPYIIRVPAGGSPGGSYYTFFASSTLNTGEIKSTAQAASLLYLTVSGKLVRTSKLQSQSIQRFVFGSSISYHFNVINTGNVYYFIYVSGRLHGLGAGPAETPAAHLIIPGKVRQFTGTIPHPLLPGIYQATYGYSTDSGTTVQRSQLIVYIPPWSIALTLLILLTLKHWFAKRKKH